MDGSALDFEIEREREKRREKKRCRWD